MQLLLGTFGLTLLLLHYVTLVVPITAQQPAALWPKPQSQTSSKLVYSLDPRSFTFIATGVKSQLLDQAIAR